MESIHTREEALKWWKNLNPRNQAEHSEFYYDKPKEELLPVEIESIWTKQLGDWDENYKDDESNWPSDDPMDRPYCDEY